jgi:hypothetical protein
METTLNVLDVIMSDGTPLRDLKEESDERGTESTYHHYYLDSGCIIEVESTARSVMEGLLSLSVEDQKCIVARIADNALSPGDKVLIGDDRKKRGARAVRLASPGNTKVISLLITH